MSIKKHQPRGSGTTQPPPGEPCVRCNRRHIRCTEPTHENGPCTQCYRTGFHPCSFITNPGPAPPLPQDFPMPSLRGRIYVPPSSPGGQAQYVLPQNANGPQQDYVPPYSVNAFLNNESSIGHGGIGQSNSIPDSFNTRAGNDQGSNTQDGNGESGRSQVSNGAGPYSTIMLRNALDSSDWGAIGQGSSSQGSTALDFLNSQGSSSQSGRTQASDHAIPTSVGAYLHVQRILERRNMSRDAILARRFRPPPWSSSFGISPPRYPLGSISQASIGRSDNNSDNLVRALSALIFGESHDNNNTNDNIDARMETIRNHLNNMYNPHVCPTHGEHGGNGRCSGDKPEGPV